MPLAVRVILRGSMDAYGVWKHTKPSLKMRTL